MFFFFQAEDGIRDLVRSRGLGDVYKRQPNSFVVFSISFSFSTKLLLAVFRNLTLLTFEG